MTTNQGVLKEISTPLDKSSRRRMSDRVTILDKAVRDIVRPVLESHAFRFDGKRTFRRQDLSKRTCQIIAFQVGLRSAAGTFTVNLGVFSPELFIGSGSVPILERADESDCLPGFRKRLGTLLESAWTKNWARLLGPSQSAWWKEVLYGARDRWWPFTANEAETRETVREVLNALQQVGLPWLEVKRNTT